MALLLTLFFCFLPLPARFSSAVVNCLFCFPFTVVNYLFCFPFTVVNYLFCFSGLSAFLSDNITLAVTVFPLFPFRKFLRDL